MKETYRKMERSHLIYLLIFASKISTVFGITTESNSFDDYDYETPENVRLNATLRMMATPCETPNREAGFCVEIAWCQILFKQIGNQAAEKFLNESICGSKRKNIQDQKVCCGKYDNFINTLNTNKFYYRKCGTQKVIGTRIFGGNQTSLGEFPWLARLIYRNKKGITSFGCTGFLISPRFVLTAAHCLAHENRELGELVVVELGEHNVETEIDCSGIVCTDPVQKIIVKNIVIHPGFNISSPDYHDDVGLIYIRKGLHLSEWVYPICLTQYLQDRFDEYVVSGWGATENGPVSAVKLKVTLPSYSHDKCESRYKTANISVVETQICAGGEKDKDSCFGDSGGPLMAEKGGKYFAAGIVSFGISCGKKGWPGIYVNTSSYFDWIVNESAKLTSKRFRKSRH